MINFDDLMNELLYGAKDNRETKKPEPKQEPEKKHEGKCDKCSKGARPEEKGCCVIVRYKEDNLSEARITLGQSDDDGKRQDSLALMYAVCNLLHDMLGIDRDQLAHDMIGGVTMSLIKGMVGAIVGGVLDDDDE